ncbi:MAG TPA: hypothetical protein ENI96_02610 [Sedimenticola thiotaurini]|uniref:FAD assembly factor SdhE n=1 Tax=Sedimenticola thiotaurini TaxID=1543721 RepID=A0A831RHE7_9GAMM|nr:hypothetical protein [Sedimenticola thiotaurini]
MTGGEGASADRLRWQCRRGMLELDLLLQGFLERGFDALGEDEKALFARMLQLEDQLLLDWLMGYVVPSDPGYMALVEKIRRAV